ncbi:uncharacterized protein LOC101860836 [Aplysia californica]|uniref:Uncharacterized protein LOC101860836 n=1 Tax=Aplysia californica TaxID=6500 RepID=A0ABM1A6H0_APLCA|nr:uncharacterized protein LOC101860836 [Aplysia californica]
MLNMWMLSIASILGTAVAVSTVVRQMTWIEGSTTTFTCSGDNVNFDKIPDSEILSVQLVKYKGPGRLFRAVASPWTNMSRNYSQPWKFSVGQDGFIIKVTIYPVRCTDQGQYFCIVEYRQKLTFLNGTEIYRYRRQLDEMRTVIVRGSNAVALYNDVQLKTQRLTKAWRQWGGYLVQPEDRIRISCQVKGPETQNHTWEWTRLCIMHTSKGEEKILHYVKEPWKVHELVSNIVLAQSFKGNCAHYTFLSWIDASLPQRALKCWTRCKFLCDRPGCNDLEQRVALGSTENEPTVKVDKLYAIGVASGITLAIVACFLVVVVPIWVGCEFILQPCSPVFALFEEKREGDDTNAGWRLQRLVDIPEAEETVEEDEASTDVPSDLDGDVDVDVDGDADGDVDGDAEM